MKKLVKNLMLISITLSTTDILRFTTEFISPFRIFMIFTIIIFAIYLLKFGKIVKGRYLFFVLIIASGALLSYITSLNKPWAKSSMINDFLGIFIILIIMNVFDIDDFQLIFKSIVYSQIVTIILSIYTYVEYLSRGKIITKISIFNILTAELSEDYIRRTLISGMPRLSLPYSTPPHLSIVMVIVITILLFQNGLFKRRVKGVLFIVFSIILFLTYSRTAIVAVSIAYILYWFKNLGNKQYNLKKLITYFIAFVSIIPTILYFIERVDILEKFIVRFAINNIMSDRHFLVPLDGLILWLSDLKFFFIGIGSGSSFYLEGQHTFFPPHFLNSFVTIVVERGILGLLMLFELFLLFKKSFKNISNKYLNINAKLISFLYMTIFTSFLFYEARQNIIVWIIISLMLFVDNRRKLYSF